MRAHNDRSEGGFNLIEVVIALALLAAVLLTIVGSPGTELEFAL